MIKLIVFIIIASFLCQNMILASPRNFHYNNLLSANSPFDTDPRNKETVGYMLTVMREKTHSGVGNKDKSDASLTNNTQLFIRRDLVGKLGNRWFSRARRLWREKQWTKEELQTSGLPNFVINIGQDGIVFADSFKDVLSSVFGLDKEKANSVAQSVSRIVNTRQRTWVRDVTTKSVTVYAVTQSPSVAGDCKNNGVGYVNLYVVNELIKGIKNEDTRLKLLSLYLGIFISHEISGHEMGIDDEQYLTMIDTFCFATILFKEIPEESMESIINAFGNIFDLRKSLLFIQYFCQYVYLYQQDLTLLSTIGVKKGDNVITVGMINFEILAQKIMELSAHYKGFELAKRYCDKVRDAISWAHERGCEGTGEQICGEFSRGSQFSAGILDHSIDYVLMTTGALSDPAPESDAVSVLKEALRVIKNGGRIVAGSFSAPWMIYEKNKQQRVIDEVLNLPEYKNKVRLVETGEGSYVNMRYKIYTVEFVDDIARSSSDNDRTVSVKAGAKSGARGDENEAQVLTSV